MELTTAQTGILIAIAIYMVAILIIGFICAKKSNTVGDFYLGGRKLGPLVTAMSAEASDMSSWLLMGLPGVAYFTGLTDAFWTAIGLAVGTYVNWLIVAKRLRQYTVVTNAITLPDFFANRYRDTSNILKFLSAAIIVIFFVPYTASGFAACGKLFSTILDVDYQVAMVISAIVIVAYTSLGGFLAASTSDFIQSIIMTIALAIVFGYGIYSVGGVDEVINNVRDLPGYLNLTQTYNPTTNAAEDYGFLKICSMLAWGLGYFGMPHILLRFMAIEDPNKLTLSRRVASVWVVISMTIAVLIGVIGFSMTAHDVLPAFGSSSEAEAVIVTIAGVISEHSFFTALIAGIILAGILASTMSTADSQLLAASSSVTENLLKDVFHFDVSPKLNMIIARASVIVISIIGVFIASDPDSSVFSIVSFAWAGFGATFGPVMLAALFWKRSNRQGAIAGMIVGGITIFVWKYLISPMGGIWEIYELLPAFVLACITIVVVSLVTKAPSEEIVYEFEDLKDMK